MPNLCSLMLFYPKVVSYGLSDKSQTREGQEGRVSDEGVAKGKEDSITWCSFCRVSPTSIIVPTVVLPLP